VNQHAIDHRPAGEHEAIVLNSKRSTTIEAPWHFSKTRVAAAAREANGPNPLVSGRITSRD
jgi:hypothetical protein